MPPLLHTLPLYYALAAYYALFIDDGFAFYIFALFLSFRAIFAALSISFSFSLTFQRLH